MQKLPGERSSPVTDQLAKNCLRHLLRKRIWGAHVRKVISTVFFAGCFCAASMNADPLTFAPVTNKPSAPIAAVTSKPSAPIALVTNKPSAPIAAVTNKASAPKQEASPSVKAFVVKDASGKGVFVPLVDDSAKRKIVAKVDPSINPTMIRAATIAQERSCAHSKSRCWRFVKEALFAAGAVSSYPKSALAKQAGDELMRDYGFRKLAVRDPYAAPVGAVLVYGGNGAGHVEIRDKTGFVSDFRNEKPSKRRLIGVFAKA